MVAKNTGARLGTTTGPVCAFFVKNYFADKVTSVVCDDDDCIWIDFGPVHHIQ